MYPVLFKIGSFEVHTFGLVLIVAFGAAYLFGRARAGKFGLTKEQVGDAFFWTLVLGVLGALAAGRLLGRLLYEVNTGDPLSIAVVVVVLGGAAGIACWGPAHVATKVDPIQALRSE